MAIWKIACILNTIFIYIIIFIEGGPVAIWKIGTECLHAFWLLPSHLRYKDINNSLLPYDNKHILLQKYLSDFCQIDNSIKNVLTQISLWFLPNRQFYIDVLTQISLEFLPSRQVSGVGALTGRARPIKLVQGHHHCFPFARNLKWIFLAKLLNRIILGLVWIDCKLFED